MARDTWPIRKLKCDGCDAKFSAACASRQELVDQAIRRGWIGRDLGDYCPVCRLAIEWDEAMAERSVAT